VSSTQPPGIIIAAPASGSGKTLITQALLRTLKNTGHRVYSAKTGPDYIDPHFHSVASGHECINLDSWAMRPEVLGQLINHISAQAELIVCEGVMGLFDGAAIDDEKADGSTASLARLTGWPVVLVVDASKQAASVAALVRGFLMHSADVHVAGLIFNQVGSPAHEAVLRAACMKHLPDVAVIGALPRQSNLTLPERHLGLVQAHEHDDLNAFLEDAARLLSEHVDVATFISLARPTKNFQVQQSQALLPPMGSRIAIAQDSSFAFLYPSIVRSWRDAGAEITYFSPLNGDHPDINANAVYLPGGYPELHAGRLASNGVLSGLQNAAKKGVFIYGECGGFMVLGRGLIDADGTRHKMAGLLPVETSFAKPKLHLGYRQLCTQLDLPFAKSGQSFRGHEFHYASVVSENQNAPPLFAATNAKGEEMGLVGCVQNQTAGSFIHLIDQV